MKTGRPPRSMPTKEELLRFGKVNGACIEWVRGITGAGYGVLTVHYKTLLVHRLSYQLHFGPIPKGMLVCHHCDNRKCFNPDHLFIGDYRDNIVDAIKKGRASGPPRCSGERHHCAKLTLQQAQAIRADTRSSRELASVYGVHVCTIRSVRNKKTYICSEQEAIQQLEAIEL